MLVALAYHSGDLSSARDLLQWIRQLDRKLNHTALLVADSAVQWSDALELIAIAKETFTSAALIVTSKPYIGWPSACNAMFLTAAKHIQNNQKCPFLWLESDCAPICKGWLDQIDKEYQTCGKPFMGPLIPCTQPGLPPSYLNGVAVYPANAFELIAPLVKDRAWDISMAEMAVPQTHNSKLFIHLWGQKDNPPTFGEIHDPTHPERKTLNAIPPGCVLFHRNKDGSLLRLLRKKLFPNVREDKHFVVVWPFFNGDAAMALKNLQWMAILPTLRTHEILLSYEKGTDRAMIQRMKITARSSFAEVHETTYPLPVRGEWPPTIAFHHAARTMQHYGRNWLWLEYDSIPLTRDWLQVLQDRYDRCRKPFAGPIVPMLGHMNGTGIYPADTPAVIPITMRTKSPAWDVVMKPEMIRQCHDMSDIFCHRWGEVGGALHPSQGPAPMFETVEKVKRLIPKSAVIFHRSKYGDLIDRMKEIFATKRNNEL